MAGTRAPIAGLTAGRRTLPRDVSKHLCRVLRLREGDRFVAFDPEARTEADAVVVVASGEAAEVTFDDVRPAAIVATSAVVLVYALAKGEKVDAVVRDATELGATHVFIARTSRAVAKAEGDRAGAKIERWKRIAVEAARQSGRADPPSIEGVMEWNDALESAAAIASARFCLWENATDALGPLLVTALESGSPVAFAVGPEGGLSDGEVEEARVRGFAAVSLGRFVLRTETVPAAVLGAVRILTKP